MTCRMMSSYIEAVITVLNQNSQFNLLDVWDTVIENECKLSFLEATDAHHAYLKQNLNNQQEAYSDSDLKKLMTEIRTSTLNVYSQVSKLSENYPDLYGEYFTKLQNYMDSKDSLIKKINNELAKT